MSHNNDASKWRGEKATHTVPLPVKIILACLRLMTGQVNVALTSAFVVVAVVVAAAEPLSRST